MKVLASQPVGFQDWFKGSVITRRGRPLRLYHGSDIKGIQQFQIPFFCTDNREDAHFYGDYVYSVFLNLQHPFDVRGWKPGDSRPYLTDIADAAGIKYSGGTAEEEFYCPEIAEYSDNEGHNDTDLIYIPRFRQELQRQGYDGVIVSDIMMNDQINVWLPLRTDQIWVERTVKPRGYR